MQDSHVVLILIDFRPLATLLLLWRLQQNGPFIRLLSAII